MLRDDVEALLENLKPVAESLDCVYELEGIRDILKNGNGSMRQREVFRKDGSHAALVNYLVRELKKPLQ